MKESKKATSIRLDGNKITLVLLVIALVLVSFNYLQTMGLMAEINEMGIPIISKGTSSVTGQVVAADGALTILEFSDFQCPFCGRAAPAVKQLREKYGNQINFVYKHFPLRNIHPQAQKAAEAVECAQDQGKFDMYHDGLFATQFDLSVNALKQLAGKIGLNQNIFDSCLDSGEKASIVERDLQEGLGKGVTGTPTFFIGNEQIGGAVPFSTLDEAVQRQLGSQ